VNDLAEEIFDSFEECLDRLIYMKNHCEFNREDAPLWMRDLGDHIDRLIKEKETFLEYIREYRDEDYIECKG
jgi:hypothetical protein